MPRRPVVALALALAPTSGCGDDPIDQPPSTATATTTATTGDPPDPTTAPDPTTGDASTSSTGEPTTTAPDADDTTTTDTSTDTSTTGAPDECIAADLEHAPPVTRVDGLTAVPLDILDTAATVTIDAATQTLTATAATRFVLGPDGGHPVFDLRQTILGAELDGAPIDPALLAHHDLGGGPAAEVRILGVALAPCSEHVLTVTYAIATPDAPDARGPQWDGARVRWDAWNSDLAPGRYLEQWFPANLIHDRFVLDLELRLLNSPDAHLLATNGATDLLGPHHWQVTWPPTATSLSMMFVLVPDAEVDTATAVVDLVDGTSLTLELWADEVLGLALADYEQSVRAILDEFVLSVGPYPHGDRFVAYAWSEEDRSMEYDGATTTNPIYTDHEAFHSWWGRALKPATQNDGWIDEAWDMHAVTIGFNETPLDLLDPPVVLASQNPWSRVTPEASYDVGERVFAGIAAMVGTPALQAAMQAFYLDHTGERITTAQLERHLYCTLDEPGVRSAFHRFVRGQDGDPPPPPPDYCG